MYKKDVIAYFNHRQANVARALNIKPPSVFYWGEIIPERMAYRLERITGGALKVNPDLYEKPANTPTEAA